jgi:hypothetical protein
MISFFFIKRKVLFVLNHGEIFIHLSFFALALFIAFFLLIMTSAKSAIMKNIKLEPRASIANATQRR